VGEHRSTAGACPNDTSLSPRSTCPPPSNNKKLTGLSTLASGGATCSGHPLFDRPIVLHEPSVCRHALDGGLLLIRRPHAPAARPVPHLAGRAPGRRVSFPPGCAPSSFFRSPFSQVPLSRERPSPRPVKFSQNPTPVPGEGGAGKSRTDRTEWARSLPSSRRSPGTGRLKPARAGLPAAPLPRLHIDLPGFSAHPAGRANWCAAAVPLAPAGEPPAAAPLPGVQFMSGPEQFPGGDRPPGSCFLMDLSAQPTPPVPRAEAT